MNLIAYSHENVAVFARHCRNKEEAKKAVVHNPWAFRVSYIVYKTKKYLMKEVYAWKE